MAVDRDDRLAQIEEDNELEDAEFGSLSRKARRKLLEERMGKKEVAQQIKDGTLSLGRRVVEKGYEKIRSGSRSEMTRRAGIGDSNRLKDANDPSTWPRRGR